MTTEQLRAEIAKLGYGVTVGLWCNPATGVVMVRAVATKDGEPAVACSGLSEHNAVGGVLVYLQGTAAPVGTVYEPTSADAPAGNGGRGGG